MNIERIKRRTSNIQRRMKKTKETEGGNLKLATDTHRLTQTFVRRTSPGKNSHRFAKKKIMLFCPCVSVCFCGKDLGIQGFLIAEPQNKEPQNFKVNTSSFDISYSTFDIQVPNT